MSKRIDDEFTNLPVSRQRKKQLRYERDGRCRICGDPKVENSPMYCEYHRQYAVWSSQETNERKKKKGLKNATRRAARAYAKESRLQRRAPQGADTAQGVPMVPDGSSQS